MVGILIANPSGLLFHILSTAIFPRGMPALNLFSSASVMGRFISCCMAAFSRVCSEQRLKISGNSSPSSVQIDILQAVLRSDSLRVGWPINFNTLEVSKEETEGSLQHLLSLVYKNRGWGIVLLSVSDVADYPNFDLTDFESTQEFTNPYHISPSGSQILTLGRWITDSPSLRQLKLAKGILIFNTPHPKGILWICPGKETPGHQEYRSFARLLGRGEDTDRQVHARLQETLVKQFDTDTSLLGTLDRMRMDILLETIHPIVEGSPAILQDHYIETDATNQETVAFHRPTHRPQIQVT